MTNLTTKSKPLEKGIPQTKIDNWFVVLDRALKTDVPYHEDKMVMADAAIKLMRKDILEVISGIVNYTEFSDD